MKTTTYKDKRLNYRHSLQTMNKALATKNYKFAYYVQSGKPTFELLENGKTCGFFYCAKDAAQIVNNLIF